MALFKTVIHGKLLVGKERFNNVRIYFRLRL